ncbi:hypothetical protein F0562_031203 [Nyssa sinensis]|uniref:Uncharacterized protein n=1 Tax=Nyssa sinensis TaxID=561372 RepID=A0A5J5AUW4_9ASTE|nr:hypothetical protein F0562_031203 [Nyssa sinensis]
MQLGKMVSLEGDQLGKHVFPPDMAVSEEAVCSIDSTLGNDGEESGEMSGFPDNRTSLGEVISTVTCQTQDVEDTVSKSDKLGPSYSSPEIANLSVLGTSVVAGQPFVGPSYPSPECENLSVLGTSAVAGQPIVTIDVKGQDDKASATDAVLINSPLHGTRELMHKSHGHSASEVGTQDDFKTYGNSGASHSSEIDLEDSFEKNMTEPQPGYESPFEDGELREAVLYSWEENEIDGETECVDYESDDREADDFDAADYSVSENVEVKQCGGGDALKEPSRPASSKTKFSGWDLLPENCECSTDRTVEVNGVSTRKIHTSDYMDGHDVKGFSTGEVRSRRASRGKLLSSIEGPSCSDVLYRKGAIVTQRSRSNNPDDSYYRAEREFGSEKSLGRDRSPLPIHERSQEDGHWVNSSAGYWDSRNHFPTAYHGPHGLGHPRPRSITADMTATVDGLTFCNQRRSINYSSKGMYRSPIRRRSPTDRDDAYHVHRVRVPVRDISRLGRGRTGIYSQGVSRGPREEYRGPEPEDPASSSVHATHYLDRRERSFSPILNRGVHFSRPHRKSRSRSRTRSPLPWHLQRERHVGDEEGFMSLPRGRISPQRNSRWIDDRNCVADHFRDRRSPVALVGYTSMMTSDYDSSRKQGDRYEMIQRARRFNTGGIVRRFRYDTEDCFEARNSHNDDGCDRGSDRRDVPRNAREERAF